MWRNILTVFLRPGIGRHFAAYILMFSSLVTLVITAVQLGFDYYRDVAVIENRLREIELVYHDTLSTALWVHNRNSLDLQLDGILRLPDMLAVQVADENGEVMASVGTGRTDRVMGRTFALTYPHRGRDVALGTVNLSADLGAVYLRILDKVVVILVTQTIKTFLVSLFILLLFYRLVGRHLVDLGRAAREIGRGALDSLPESPRDDELGELTRAMNMTIATLSRSREEVGRMATVMAHHFQEPVRRIVTFAQMLRRTGGTGEGPDGLDRRELESLDFIEGEARRLRNIVRDIQIYLNAWQTAPGRAAVDSGVELRSVLSSFSTAGAMGDARIEIGEMPAVLVDRNCLRDLFAQLLDNAIRYRRTDRPLTLGIRTECRSGRAVFHFSDNGIGVPAEYRERVFDLFERIASGPESTGVGLSVARKIVETVGGTIHVEDAPEGGASVVFDVPLAETEAP